MYHRKRENTGEMMGAAVTPVCGCEDPKILESRARARVSSPRAYYFVMYACRNAPSLMEAFLNYPLCVVDLYDFCMLLHPVYYCIFICITYV